MAQLTPAIDHSSLVHIPTQNDEVWNTDERESDARLACCRRSVEAVPQLSYGLQIDLGQSIAKARRHETGASRDLELLLLRDQPQFGCEACRAKGGVPA